MSDKNHIVMSLNFDYVQISHEAQRPPCHWEVGMAHSRPSLEQPKSEMLPELVDYFNMSAHCGRYLTQYYMVLVRCDLPGNLRSESRQE